MECFGAVILGIVILLALGVGAVAAMFAVVGIAAYIGYAVADVPGLLVGGVVGCLLLSAGKRR